jgi:hypothetical protein
MSFMIPWLSKIERFLESVSLEMTVVKEFVIAAAKIVDVDVIVRFRFKQY